MSEAKFTKGEWVVDPFFSLRLHVGTKEGKVCELCRDRYSEAEVYTPEEVANAHLIAAAPEMYVMLEKIADDNRGLDDGWVESIDNLLAKARGE